MLILDEPTTGLDPNQIVEIRNIIAEIGTHKTVLLSTHIMQEVEAICNRVIIINNGKIVADNDSHAIKNESQKNTTTVLWVLNNVRLVLQQIPHVIDVVNVSEKNGLYHHQNDDIREHIFNLQ